MSHEIDTSTGKAAIAYVGEKPWHGLGAELQPGQDIETWRKAAGLDWEVHESPVIYQNGEQRVWNERKVLYRSDNGAPLSVMGEGFNVVQPADVLNLYKEIAKAGGFELETAGALSGGKRIWALAKVSDGANVVGTDRVRPYVLLGTAFDGSMATTAKFMATRVVCNNTIEAGLAEHSHAARVLHSTKWNDKVAEQVRLDLGVVHNAYERFMVEARQLAERPMNDTEADIFTATLLAPYVGKKDGKSRDVRETRGYKRIMELFTQSKAIGADLAGKTRWGWLNSVTQMIDHERGRNAATRLESAWFGSGNSIKTRAREILVSSKIDERAEVVEAEVV